MCQWWYCFYNIKKDNLNYIISSFMRNEKNVKNKGGKYFKWLRLDTQTNDIKKLFNILARTVLKI